MGKLHEFTNRIPLWVYNVLTIVSGVIAIVTFAASGIAWLINRLSFPGNIYWFFSIFALIGVIGVLCTKIFKYRKLLRMRLKMTSNGIHDLTHSFRDAFFDILHEYKLGSMTVPLLTKDVEDCIRTGLDALCCVMNAFTGEEVSACIKLIECAEDSSEIVSGNAKVKVFCRSKNSDSRRFSYDNSTERAEMYVKNDTALMRIVGPDAHQDHFYCGDLDKFEKACQEAQQEYCCPNKNRPEYYNGTMVLPIRVLYKRLYYFKKNDAYHIIGFLCVDSLSKNAFQANQEKYNCQVGNAFADEFYVILSKYKHYLKKLKTPPTPSQMSESTTQQI